MGIQLHRSGLMSFMAQMRPYRMRRGETKADTDELE